VTAGRRNGAALLCLLVFCNTLSISAFGPLFPEIGRTEGLADWQLGVLVGSFGLARMVADLPSGALAGRHLALTLVLSPAIILAGMLMLATAGPFPVLVLGRVFTGIGHTLGMVGGLTAILREDGGRSASFRLNVFEFSGMLGVLGGLASVGVLPAGWGWPVSLVTASAPLVVALATGPALWRRFPTDLHDSPPMSGIDGGRPSRSRAPVWFMFGVGAILAIAWSSVSQFLVPLRATREFGLDRRGVSALLALPQLVDLAALLPVGWLADRAGRVPVLGAVLLVLGAGTWATGLGPFPLVVAGSALFGMGMAGWMLPMGLIREHIGLRSLAWWTGLYRVGLDAAAFLGPLICGLMGEAHTAAFIAPIGLASIAAGGRLVWRGLP